MLPEIFVGTSAGAIVGAMYAQDIPLDVLLDGYRLPWRRRHQGPRLHMSTFLGAPTKNELFDVGHLASGVFSIRKLERYLRQHLPINSFRRLAKPVFVTAVDIDTSERVVFGPGHVDDVPISEAVAASCCVPGLFRPIKINGRYYVDGEVARTLSARHRRRSRRQRGDHLEHLPPGSPRSIRSGRSRASGLNQVLRQSLSHPASQRRSARGVELLEQALPARDLHRHRPRPRQLRLPQPLLGAPDGHARLRHRPSRARCRQGEPRVRERGAGGLASGVAVGELTGGRLIPLPVPSPRSEVRGPSPTPRSEPEPEPEPEPESESRSRARR